MSMRRCVSSPLLIFLACFLATVHLAAQIRFPGQSPFPGGQYPNGGGNGGNGNGRGSGSSRSTRGRKEAPPTITTTGILRLVSGSQFVLEADDHRIITYKTTGNTKVEKDGKTIGLKDLATADHLTIDSTADEDGYFTATGVIFNLPGTAEDRAAAARTWDLPALTASRPVSSASGAAPSGSSRDDDDRPILRRTAKGSDSTTDASTNAPQPSTNNPQPSAAGNAASAGATQPAPDEVADNRPANNLPTTIVRDNDPPPDADDPGKPQLRRGRPTSYPRAVRLDDGAAPPVAGPPPAATASANERSPRIADRLRAADPSKDAPPVIPIEQDPIIAKAKAAAAQYSSTLPDFFCRQVTTRYESDQPKDGWQALDTVTADVAYENGRESYKNIKIGNKAVNVESMEQISGSSSSGEFASILEDLFDPFTAASFRKKGQDSIRGRSAYTYTYEVKRENSHWRIMTGAQLYYPAYRGTVWIDRETSRVLRIEMESRNVPVLFPFDKTETATDYDFVRLSTPEQFLMPVTAEVLSCETGSSRCLRNRIEFRNYRKFGAESDITFN
jgi:hypothetical protein